MAATKKKKAKKDTSFTTWKIRLENTVNADPRLGPACLKIVRAYLDWMGSPTARPYLSILHLRIVTALAENTIIKGRRELEREGYFVPDGKTSSGAIMYRITNAGENRVLDHIAIARETLNLMEAEKKEKERRKKKNSPAETEGPMSPAENEGQKADQPFRNYGDSPSEFEGNNVYDSVDAYSNEEEGDLNEASLDAMNSYSSADDGDEANQPLPIPKDKNEAEAMMDAICHGRVVSAFMRSRLTSMLQSGVLTPRMAENIIGPSKEEEAA